MPLPAKPSAKHRTSREAVLSRLAVLVVLSMSAACGSAWVADHMRALNGGKPTLVEQALRIPGYVLQLWEWKLQNLVHVSARSAPTREDVVILGIDDSTLSLKSAFDEDIEASTTLRLMKEGWPWSREVYATVVDRLLEAGAKGVIIDLMFPNPSPSHPEGDEVLRKTLARHPGKVVLGADFARSLTANGVVPSLTLPCDEIMPDDVTPPQPVGFVNYWADDDGIVRQARFSRTKSEENGDPIRADEQHFPSLVAAALISGGRANAIPANALAPLVHFGDPDAYEPQSLHEILVPDLWKQNFGNGAAFKDKFVFIGPAASHMQDYHVTPVGRILGVQVHAHVLAAALSGSFLHAMPPWWRAILIPLAGFLAWALVVLWGRPMATLFALMGLTLLGVAACWCLFVFAGVVAEGVAPLLTLNMVGLTGLAYDAVLARRRMEALRGQLSRYFSPDHAEELLRDPEGVEAMTAGQRRTVVVLFSDVRGFTSMAENRPADELVKQLNEYLDSMVQIAFGQKGMIDKFIGDAIMAIWGRMGGKQSEKEIVEDARKAVTTALRMRVGMIELNERWIKEGQPVLAYGLGIHQGEAIAGDIGSASMPRMEFTVIGDSVNTAARLESATKQYGLDALISNVVYERIKEHFIWRTVDLAKPVGKTIAVPTYTVLGYAGETPPAGLASFEKGIALYRPPADFAAAISCFQEAAALGLDDKLTHVYIDRCKELLANPPAQWDGVYVMTKK